MFCELLKRIETRIEEKPFFTLTELRVAALLLKAEQAVLFKSWRERFILAALVVRYFNLTEDFKETLLIIARMRQDSSEIKMIYTILEDQSLIFKEESSRIVVTGELFTNYVLTDWSLENAEKEIPSIVRLGGSGRIICGKRDKVYVALSSRSFSKDVLAALSLSVTIPLWLTPDFGLIHIDVENDGNKYYLSRTSQNDGLQLYIRRKWCCYDLVRTFKERDGKLC